MPLETDRRSLILASGALAAAAGAGPVQAAAGAPALPPPADWLTLRPDADGIVRFAVDVAVIGNSDAINPGGRIGPRDSQDYFNIDVRGDTFQVEGALYPGGTIPDPTTPTKSRSGKTSVHYELNWDFTRAQPSGHWLSRGWVLINGNREPARDTRGTIVETRRTEPHLLTDHNYVLGRFASDNLAPEMLISNGMDDGDDPDREVLVRAITGGTGRFRFATGQVVERRLGRNTSVLRSFSQFPEAYAPNYRFEFELKL
ncbi:MAG: hypothetical protein ACK4MX_05995 [Thermaurantiacus sp.]